MDELEAKWTKMFTEIGKHFELSGEALEEFVESMMKKKDEIFEQYKETANG